MQPDEHTTTLESLRSRRALAELVRPFVGARLHRQPDPASLYGRFLPRTSAIDIRCDGVCMRDADIRSVTSEGIERFFYSGCELIRWADIRSITIAALDADGNRVAERTYEPAKLECAA